MTGNTLSEKNYELKLWQIQKEDSGNILTFLFLLLFLDVTLHLQEKNKKEKVCSI